MAFDPFEFDVRIRWSAFEYDSRMLAIRRRDLFDGGIPRNMQYKRCISQHSAQRKLKHPPKKHKP